MSNSEDWKQQAVILAQQGYSWRSVAKMLGVAKSTVSDWLRKVVAGSEAVEVSQEDKPRILLVDVENAPYTAYVWQRWKANIGQDQSIQDGYLLSFSAKWLGQDEILFEHITERENDKNIVESLHNLFNQADVIVAHNCVEENTLVLKADLTWVKAGDLVVGDEVVGFDEKLNPYSTLRDEEGNWRKTGSGSRKTKLAKVTSNFIEVKPCFEVLLSNGDILTTTGDHYWLAKPPKSDDQNWKCTKDMKAGDRLVKYIKPSAKSFDYDSGWITGFLAGEGSFHRNRIDFCQRPTSTWKQALDILKKKGMAVSEGRSPKTGGLGRQDTLYATINGGKWNTLQFLSECRVERFIEKLDWNKFGNIGGQYLEEVTVISVTPVGNKRVAVLSTDTKTFIAEGYAMHNCDRFDEPLIKTRFLHWGFEPPAPYKTVDTLKIAKKQFRFPSNSLDSIAVYLGLDRKKKHEGFNLWVRCMNLEQEAFDEMEEYNVQDIVVLEQVYLKLRAWDNQHPNIALYYSDNKARCVCCGSEDIKPISKSSYTQLSEFETVSCKSCGKKQRKRVNLRGKQEMKNTMTNVI